MLPGALLLSETLSRPIRIPYHTSLRKTTTNGGSTLLDGEVFFKFVIFRGDIIEDTTWEPVWSPNPGYVSGLDPDRENPVPEPAHFIKVDVDRGAASVGIGDNTITVWESPGSQLTAVPEGGSALEIVTMQELNPAMFEGGHFYLRVWLSEDGNSFDVLSPDVAIMGTALALRATVAEEVIQGAVTKDSMETDLKNLISQLETFAQYMDQVVVMSDSGTDANLNDQGFEVIKSFPADPWKNLDGANPPTGRMNHQMTWTGSQLLVWGGKSSNNGFRMGTGAFYDPNTAYWETMSPVSAPIGRDQHLGVWTGSRWIIWGGVSDSAILKDGAIFNPANNSWSSMAAAPNEMEARVDFAKAWTGRYLAFFGGRSAGGILGDGWVYDSQEDLWSPLPDYPGDAVFDCSGAWVDGKFMVWGGQFEAGYSDTGYYYDPDPSWTGGSWTSISSSGLTARAAHLAVASNNQVFIWGGRQNSSNVFSDGALWNASDNTWTALGSTSLTFGASYDPAGAWTGSEFFLFGGRSSSGVSGNSFFYDPSTAAWRDDPDSAPEGRHGTAVVHASGRNELILFGGETSVGGGGLNDIWTVPENKGLYLYKKANP